MIRSTALIVITGLSLLCLAGGCAMLPQDFDRPLSYAYTDTDNTRLGQARLEEKQVHPGRSGFLLLRNGVDAFVARALLADAAERSIDVQYYLYHNDFIGKLLTDYLVKAADRGVRVRVLVDDRDLEGGDLGAAVADAHPNIEIRIFNPFARNSSRIVQFVTRLGSVTRRMHNKAFIVDNQVAIVGGRNIGDEYFEADPDLSFSDLDVLAIGPVVDEVSAAFDRYWNNDLSYPVSALFDQPLTPEVVNQKYQELDEFVAGQADSVYLQALQNSDLAQEVRHGLVRFHWGHADVVYDKPEKVLHAFDKTEYHLAPQLKHYFTGVQDELIIYSPYFVPLKVGNRSFIPAKPTRCAGAHIDQFAGIQ